jgi:hypothetical protein
MISRLDADERKRFAAYARDMEAQRRCRQPITPPEPALGSRSERLANIIRRQGGTSGPIRLTPRERREASRLGTLEIAS